MNDTGRQLRAARKEENVRKSNIKVKTEHIMKPRII